jgi:benzoate-CoA ligase
MPAAAAKAAFVDDHGALSYGALDDRVRAWPPRCGPLGVKREERVLLLMLDNARLAGGLSGRDVRRPGAGGGEHAADRRRLRLHAGARRAQAVLVSGALLPALTAAMVKSDHEVQKVIVSHPGRRCTRPRSTSRPSGRAGTAVASRPPPGRRPRLLALFIGFHRPPQGHGAFARQPLLDGRALRQGRAGLTEDDVCFSAAKLFFAYGLGNALSFPMSVGATTVLMERAADARGRLQALAAAGARPQARPTVFFGAPTGFAGMLALRPAGAPATWRCAWCRRPARPAGRTGRSASRRHFGVDIVDGIGSTEMLHIFLSATGPAACATAPPAGRCPATTSNCVATTAGPCPTASPATSTSTARGRDDVLGQPQKTRDTFQGGWTKSGDKYMRNADGSYTYGGRSDDMLKVSGIYVSPFEVEATLVQHPAVLEAAVIGVRTPRA